MTVAFYRCKNVDTLNSDFLHRRPLSYQPFTKIAAIQNGLERSFSHLQLQGFFPFYQNSTIGNSGNAGSREAGGFVNRLVYDFMIYFFYLLQSNLLSTGASTHWNM